MPRAHGIGVTSSRTAQFGSLPAATRTTPGPTRSATMASDSRIVRPCSAAGTNEGAHRLLDRLLRRWKLLGVLEAAEGEVLQRLAAESGDGGLDGGDLIHHVDAVAALFDHALDAPGLTFDPLQAIDHLG